MTLLRFCAAAALLLPSLALGASREILDLQRDVALLQEQLRTLQRSQDEKLAALTVLAQQSLDASNKANTAVAVLENNIRQSIRDQEKNVVAPVVGVGAKIDQMANDFRALSNSVGDLTTLLGKLQQQMVDLGNAVKTLQAPAPPPPAVSGGPPQETASGAPPIPAETLWANAMRDRSGGRSDLAVQEFGDYLKYYGSTELAPAAQFYIGEIHFSQGKLEDALKEFDMVLERYPDNKKTADALLMKGNTLVKMSRRTQGAQEFQELIKRFPNSDQANQACSQLKALGLKCGSPRAASPATSKKSSARRR